MGCSACRLMVFYRAAGTPPGLTSRTGSPACHVARSSSSSCFRRVVAVRRRNRPRSRRRPAASHRGAPTGIDASWYDDHSVIGDGHLSWSSEGGDIYTNFGQAVPERTEGHRVRPALTVSGAGGLEVCGYPSGRWAGCAPTRRRPAWTASGSCPASRAGDRPARMVPLHLRPPQPTDAFNRWHIMDLERFALVPLPAAVADRVGQPLGNVSGSRDRPDQVSCQSDRAADGSTWASRPAPRSRRGSTTRRRPDTPGIIDEQVIPIPEHAAAQRRAAATASTRSST